MALKKIFYDLMSKQHYQCSVNELNRLQRQLKTSAARFAIPFIFKGKGHFKWMECKQNQYEMRALLDLVAELKPKRLLEIGTAKGGSLYLWLQAAAADATVISVDLPDGEFGGGYPALREPFYHAFCQPHQKLHLIRADSHTKATFNQVKDVLKGEQLDLLFIDGDHTYEGAKLDFEQYGPLVRPGGLIGFHDILPRADIPEIQVSRLWNEVKGKYEAWELIGPPGAERTIGSGVIRVPLCQTKCL